MKVYYELDLSTFEAWSGAEQTLDKVEEADKVSELESILEDIFPEGCSQTELNDFLWFEDNQIFEMLGMTEDEDSEEETEDEE